MDLHSATQALEKLGLDPGRIDSFLRGETIVYQLSTEGDPGIAMIELAGVRLRSGIIEINDRGNGLKDLGLFRTRSRAVAKALDLNELELFAGAVINEKLERLLIRQGFQRLENPVPDDLGGGIMEILSKTFPVSSDEG